jgi:hypothetical protein
MVSPDDANGGSLSSELQAGSIVIVGFDRWPDVRHARPATEPDP